MSFIKVLLIRSNKPISNFINPFIQKINKMRKNNDILDENSQRTKGVDALTSNIEAAKAVAEIVKTTLGPMGMDKMLIDSAGNTIITNDGVKILKEMEIDHPGAKMLVEVAKTQESEVGDGTTTAVILSGELLSQAQMLLKQKIHPTTIIAAYKKASTKALEVLEKKAIPVNTDDKKLLRDLCGTAMTGKAAEYSKERLSTVIFEAVNFVKDEKGVPRKRIKIQKATGGSTDDSFIVRGIVLDKDPANVNMPERVKDASILLVDFPLEVRELDSEAKVNINSLEEYEEFIKGEKDYLTSIVEKIKSVGADVVVCQKGIDDNVAYFLAKENILAVRRTRKSDLEKLSHALNKRIVSNLDDIRKEHLGSALNVEVKEILGENYIFVEGCENPKAITIFLKASTVHVLDEIERAVDDAIGDISALIRSKKIVPGGGAIELELYRELLNFSRTSTGKEQLIIKAFAEAFLIVPKVLCENSGLDEIDTIASMIARHEKEETNCGINSFRGIVPDTIKEGIVEPIDIKSQAIKSATEISAMILRIDDIIAARRLKGNEIGDLDTDM